MFQIEPQSPTSHSTLLQRLTAELCDNLQSIAQDSTPGEEAETEQAAEFPRPSLREFVVEAFPLLTTAPKYIDNWHIHALCDHLTACSAGQIKKLIINLPPGFMKSVLCDVAWPAWEWIDRPSRQFLFGTYHDWLSTRDSVATRNLIESNWYQARWGKRFKLASGANEKRLFYNSRSGFRLATTVATGFAIGAHVDISLCLPYNAPIRTKAGDLPIGDIVEQRLPVLVLSRNDATGQAEWRSIDRYEKNPGRPLLRITTASGRVVRCTREHPVYVDGVGYVQAERVAIGDRLVSAAENLRQMPEAVPMQALEPEKILLAPMLSGGPSGQRDYLPTLRQKEDHPAVACRQNRASDRALLFAILFPSIPAGSSSPRLPGHLSDYLQNLQAAGEVAATPAQKGCSVLFGQVPAIATGKTLQAPLPSLRRCNDAGQVSVRQANVLLQEVRVGRPFQTDHRPWKRALAARPEQPALYQRLQADRQVDSEAGREPLPIVLREAEGLRQGIRRSPPRFQYEEQRRHEPDHGLPPLPWEVSRQPAQPPVLATEVVVDIAEEPAPEAVYNIGVDGNRNYFTDGLLVHNCDDPIDPRRARSKSAQDAVTEWYDAGISGRGNVPEEYVRIVVHQRLGKKDLSGHLLAMGGWEHLVIPMHYNPKRSKVTSLGWKDPRTKEGELAWPELFPESVVKELRNSLRTPGAIACQHEQDPMDAEGAMFNEDMFCWFDWIQDEELEKQLLRDRKLARRIRGIFRLHHVDPDTNEETEIEDILADDCMFFEVYDTAMKDGQDNDFTVGTVAFRTPIKRDLGFFNVKREKLKIPDQADFIVRQRAQFPYLSWDGVESKNSGIGLIQLFDRSGRPLRDFKADTDKVRRAQPLSTLCKRRKVFLMAGAPWVPEFVKEVCAFPSPDEHDDQVDTAAYAAQEYDNADNMGPRARKL